MDGSIIEQNLRDIKKNKEWLLKELKKQNVFNYKKEVIIAEINSSLQLEVLRK
ncbi:hypothetical protein SDC9_191348 [bioreactor metagenome]|uniref:YetF C-terminal domain-containing protein n=1 Tax=bioreactor metagenome TaxID=1076179 RepID=A0A645HXR3_9ZZZZ